MILLILAVILGLLPVVLISIFIIIRDKEREPVSTLIKYYALGLLAVILTLIISGILNIEQEPSHGALILFMEVLFGIAFIEEGSKWISVSSARSTCPSIISNGSDSSEVLPFIRQPLADWISLRGWNSIVFGCDSGVSRYVILTLRQFIFASMMRFTQLFPWNHWGSVTYTSGPFGPS